MFIIFDLDDTIVDTSGAITPFLLQEALKELLPPNCCQSRFAEAYSALLEKNKLLARSKEALLSFADELSAKEEKKINAVKRLTGPLPLNFQVPVTHHAKEVLAHFSTISQMALVTVGSRHLQEDKLKKAGIDSSIFSMIHILEDPFKKPSYQEVQEKFSLAPEDIWVCGDRIETDLRPAYELGFHTVHMRWGRGKSCKREKWINHFIENLQELKDIIR